MTTTFRADVVSQHVDAEQVTDVWHDDFPTLAEAYAAAVEIMRMARADLTNDDIAILCFIEDPAGSQGWRIDEMVDESYVLCEFGTMIEVTP